MSGMSLVGFFSPGPGEMMVFGLIALLLFGKRLPEVARSLGKGLVEFKRGVQGIENDVSEAVNAQPKSSSSARPAPREEKDEVTAPKFEPPRFDLDDTKASTN